MPNQKLRRWLFCLRRGESRRPVLPGDGVRRGPHASPRDRAVLHERIALRFNKMLAAGFVDEVKCLQARGDLHEALPAIRAVGYRQAWDYLNGTLSYDAMVERGIIATRQLAKRQFTWLRGWSTSPNSDLHWV